MQGKQSAGIVVGVAKSSLSEASQYGNVGHLLVKEVGLTGWVYI